MTTLTNFLDDEIEALVKYLGGADEKKMKMKMTKPEFAVHVAKQNLVLNFLLSSLSREMLQCVSSYTTPQ
jgi:hypothetical protein